MQDHARLCSQSSIFCLDQIRAFFEFPRDDVHLLVCCFLVVADCARAVFRRGLLIPHFFICWFWTLSPYPLRCYRLTVTVISVSRGRSAIVYLFVADLRERGYATQPTSVCLRTQNLKDKIHLLRDYRPVSWWFYPALHGLPSRFLRIFLARVGTNTCYAA